MSVLLCFFACSADPYMTFPCFLKHFPLPPQSLPAELIELLLHHPWSSATTPPYSHVVQKMASLMQEWGSSGVDTFWCWGCCGLGEHTFPGLRRAAWAGPGATDGIAQHAALHASDLHNLPPSAMEGMLYLCGAKEKAWMAQESTLPESCLCPKYSIEKVIQPIVMLQNNPKTSLKFRLILAMVH